MKRNNKKGFTIVELVIVIAVIGILAAVLIPTFSKVIDNANESADLQEARNSYTKYISAHPEADIDYVKNAEGKIYNIKNDYKIVKEEEVVENSTVLVIDTCLEEKGTDDDGKCDACGWTLTENKDT